MRELQPIKESSKDFDAIEKRISKVFRSLIYLPLLRELDASEKLVNSNEALLRALQTGRVSYSGGRLSLRFGGKFSSQIIKELKALGAEWDRKNATFKIKASEFPVDVRAKISISKARFEEKLKRLDRRLEKILPEKIAGSVQISDIFDSTLWKTDRALGKTMARITVSPELSPERRRRIAKEWQDNMELWIKDFIAEEIVKLRKDIQDSVFKGKRREAVVKAIQKSYGVSANKAKFLARQETSLLLTKFKEVRYTESGISKYRWGCVVGSKNHPVRPAHKKLEGKIFSWDNPPITTEPGQPVRRNNPGQDYNCRCFAKPIVDFRR